MTASSVQIQASERQMAMPVPAVLLLVAFLLLDPLPVAYCDGGRWMVLKRSVGISAMHMALLPNNKLVMFDRTDFGVSNMSLPDGRCRDDTADTAVTHDCSAHSVEFDPAGRHVRPLTILTDTFCSSGSITVDGVLIQTGGFNDGDHVVRYLDSGRPGSDWREDPNELTARRWYATNTILEDGKTAVVVGGRRQFNYEYVPKRNNNGYSVSVMDLPFLEQTNDPGVENNLYPFVHLNVDGHLFIFANTKSILLDHVHNRVVRTFPEMPGGAARNYPSTGSSVLLPLELAGEGASVEAEVMVCGGTPPHSFLMTKKDVFLPVDDSCGRMKITAAEPKWVMEKMPLRRAMGDMVMLPTGDVLIINGVAAGSAGWTKGRQPVLTPVLYRTGDRKFETMAPSETPRVYHSTAHLMSDGRVAVGGSNPNVKYDFSNVLFPTELSLEAYYPPYLTKYEGTGLSRPAITAVGAGTEVKYGERLTVTFTTNRGSANGAKVTMVSAAFTTHSFSMNQRLLVLKTDAPRRLAGASYQIAAVAPAKAALAPAGYYMLFVVLDGVPSRGDMGEDSVTCIDY